MSQAVKHVNIINEKTVKNIRNQHIKGNILAPYAAIFIQLTMC